MSTKQQTLKAPISFSGKGLHTGVKVTMTVNPAEAGTGIVFRRTDLEGQPIIPALCVNVVDTSRGTTVEAGGHRVHTIEHIMSALWTLGVDNAVIDIDAPETPIMDGLGLGRECPQPIAAVCQFVDHSSVLLDNVHKFSVMDITANFITSSCALPNALSNSLFTSLTAEPP